MLEVTVHPAVDLLGIQPNSAALFCRKLCEVIAYYLEQEAHEIFEGAVERDERYSGGVRKGKCGRGAGGKVYNKVMGDTRTEPLRPLITGESTPDSIVYTGCTRSDNALDGSDFHHERINHSALFAKG